MDATLGGHGVAHEYLVWLAVLAAFAASCLGMALVYRRLRRHVELERAEAVLAEEYDQLDAP